MVSFIGSRFGFGGPYNSAVLDGILKMIPENKHIEQVTRKTMLKIRNPLIRDFFLDVTRPPDLIENPGMFAGLPLLRFHQDGLIFFSGKHSSLGWSS